MNALVVRALSEAEVARRHAEFAAFERAFVYPLGSDRFHIDHGRDYLAFFRELGTPALQLAERDGCVTGVLVAVRRRLAGHDAWYLCDLKARHGARQLLMAFARDHVAPETCVFGISMNAADGSNRLVQIARRCPAAAPLRTTGLLLFAFDHAGWLRVGRTLERGLGPIRFHDSRGTKDIVLASTGAPMPLLHAQHGPFARTRLADARPGSTHMICLPDGHPLVTELACLGAVPTASATLLLRGMDWFDPAHVLSSDI